MAPVFDLVDTAREIAKADALVAAVTSEKLGQIAEQIRTLQEQARTVLARAHRDAELHRAECRFQKVPGQTYHLYRRERDGSNALYFSMLSLDDWRGRAPDVFVGSYRLEADLSFTGDDERDARDARSLAAKRLLP
jgi:hypothetical protein